LDFSDKETEVEDEEVEEAEDTFVEGFVEDVKVALFAFRIL
jgi:hypothetical protein